MGQDELKEELKDDIFNGVIDGNAGSVSRQTVRALEEGIPAEEVLYEALIPALREVGVMFENGEIFVPEMLIGAKAMKAGLSILRPLLSAKDTKPVGTYLLLTVKGDIHDIGKDLVRVMLEGAGFNVVDLGVNVPAEKMLEAINEHEPQIVGFSAFLTTTMPQFKVNIAALKQAGLRDKVKVMVGGAPVNEEYALHVGADAYTARCQYGYPHCPRLYSQPGHLGLYSAPGPAHAFENLCQTRGERPRPTQADAARWLPNPLSLRWSECLPCYATKSPTVCRILSGCTMSASSKR